MRAGTVVAPATPSGKALAGVAAGVPAGVVSTAGLVATGVATASPVLRATLVSVEVDCAAVVGVVFT